MERRFAAQQLRQPEYGLFSISVELYDEKDFSTGNIGCGGKRIQRTVKPVVFFRYRKLLLPVIINRKKTDLICNSFRKIRQFQSNRQKPVVPV